MSPRGGQPHDHAYEVETLQEKADRIRREQGLPPENDEVPQPCHWYDDGHGGRFLIPGCMARVINPDVEECSCKTIEEQLEAARAEIASLKRARDSLQTWHDHVTRAVYDHPDGIKIMKRAADRPDGIVRCPPGCVACATDESHDPTPRPDDTTGDPR